MDRASDFGPKVIGSTPIKRNCWSATYWSTGAGGPWRLLSSGGHWRLLSSYYGPRVNRSVVSAARNTALSLFMTLLSALRIKNPTNCWSATYWSTGAGGHWRLLSSGGHWRLLSSYYGPRVNRSVVSAARNTAH